MRRARVFLLMVVTVAALTAPSYAQILQMSELNTEQIRALDRTKTVILIPGGILEEHGPYLPSFTDGYADAAFTEALARAIVARPGWTAVIFPQIPLGFGGANNIGSKFNFPGTYTVRAATLRAVYMDMGNELGQQGFRWIFLVHNHGDPLHNHVLDQASDYFHDTYGGTMVHLFGIDSVMECCGTKDKMFTPAERAEEGFTVHGGADEHSQILFLRPDLVDSGYKKARSVTGKNFDDLYRLAASPDWPGYFGAPRLTNAALGAGDFAEQCRRLNEMALKILEGFDYHGLPRFADNLDPRDAIGQAEELAHEQQIEKKEADWLKAHDKR